MGAFGWATQGWVLPQAAMLEDLSDDGLLVGFDERDDLHGSAAAGASERVGLVDAADEDGPAPPGEAVSVLSGGVTRPR